MRRFYVTILAIVCLCSERRIVTRAKITDAQRKWINDTEFTTKYMSDFKGRIVLNEETYDLTCTCKPANPVNEMESCAPTQITINLLKQFDGNEVDANRPVLDAKNLRRLIGSPENLRIVNVLKHSFSSVDGRSSDELLGTWGGDAGELLLVAATWEDDQGSDLTPDRLRDLILRYLTFMQQEFFYMHSDTRALAWIETEVGFDRYEHEVPWMDITRPPREFHGAILDALIDPKGQGSIMFKKMLEVPEQYKIRPQLVHDFIKVLHMVLWNPIEKLNAKIKYYILHSAEVRHESAWVDFEIGKRCDMEQRAVMFPPYSNDISIFVHHPQAVRIKRNQSATFVQSMIAGMGKAETLAEKLQKKGDDWDKATLHAVQDELLAGLPHYRVVVSNDVPAS